MKVLPEKYYSFKLLIKNFEGYVGNQLVKLSVDVKITYKKSLVVFSSIYTSSQRDLIFFHPKGAAGPSLVCACMTGIAKMFLMSQFLCPLERLNSQVSKKESSTSR